MAEAKITVLVENTAGRRGTLAEHGLAFWIEWGGRKVLFDTGQGGALLHNARHLRVTLTSIDAVVLSHGHYDHAGGLGQALRNAHATTVYASSAVFEPKYARNADGSAREIGMPEMDLPALRDLAEVVLVAGPTEVCHGLYVTGPIPRSTDFEDTGGAFFKDPDCSVPDDLMDDQAAFLQTSAGTVVILGCCHAGLVNTLRYVQQITEGRPIHTVIGGMHLLHASPRRMDRTIDELRHMDVRRLLPCHCTGFEATARLWNALPGRVHACRVGTVVEA